MMITKSDLVWIWDRMSQGVFNADDREVFLSAADELDRLTTELAAAKKDAERWKYWKPRLIAADFEWGQLKEPVLVFSLNCKISADIDKSTDEAIAAIAAQEPNK